jgi:hypothetical protein
MTQNAKVVKKENTRKHKKLTVQKGSELANVYKGKEFDDFVKWMGLPSLLKGRDADYLEKIGITDEDDLKLLEIKNMTAFAQRYKLEPTTLSEWKKKANALGLLDVTKDFYRPMTSNVYQAFYFETLKNGDAARVKLWLEEFAGKAPEAPPIINQNILTPQFNQVIGQMKVEYKEKLRKFYEQQIRKSDKVRSSE